MKVMKLATFGMVGALAALAGCNGTGTTIYLDANDDGTTVTIAVSGRIVVTLDSNASTGYAWEYLEVDDGVLENTDQAYDPPTIFTPGAGGAEVWEFTARNAGTTTLSLEYRGPGGDADVGGTFEVTVIVTPDAPAVELDEDDDGTEVTIAVSETLTVTLASNATTGYAWEYLEVDDGVLENTGQEYVPDEAPEGMVGVGGVEIWEFTGRTAGTTTLRLEYRQPWMPEEEPADSFEVQVTVTEAQ